MSKDSQRGSSQILLTILLLLGLLVGLYLIKTPVVLKSKAASSTIEVSPKVVNNGDTYQIGWVNGSKDQVDTIRVTSQNGQTSTIYTTSCDISSEGLPPRPAGRCTFKAYLSQQMSEVYKVELVSGLGQVLAETQLQVMYSQ